MNKYIDFHGIPEQERAAHTRLLNWARWVRPGASSWVSPMFRHYRARRGRDVEVYGAATRLAIEPNDAWAVERVVGALPRPQAEALRWFYVRGGPYGAVCRRLGLDKVMLRAALTQAMKVIAGTPKIN